MKHNRGLFVKQLICAEYIATLIVDLFELIRQIRNRIAISLFQHNGTLALTVNSHLLKKTAGV